VNRVLVGFVIAYLMVGVVIAVVTRPEQTWTCLEPPIPGEFSGGEMNYMVDPARENPAAENCRKSVTMVDQAQWIAFATPMWPLLAPKVLLTVR
jgi:hypothetical protein